MSRLYIMSRNVSVIIDRLKREQIPTLKLVVQCYTPDFELSFWPLGVTDGKGNYAWFEERDMILAWGANNEREILEVLRCHGFRVVMTG